MEENDVAYKIDVGIEEFILLAIVVLNILDFMEVLPADFDYIKKIISWTALGYLLYKASLTEIFFATRHKKVDIILILAYFAMIIKNFVGYALSAIHEGASTFLLSWYHFVLDNASIIERWSFILGGSTLIILAVYISFKFYIRKPSIMEVIHGEGPPPKNPIKMFARTSMVFLILVGFFVIVFNLVMEWLAIAIDAPLAVIGIFFYIFFFMKHKDKFHPETAIYKIGDVGEEFYNNFISLFHSKVTLFLGISGMLVLHSLTEIGNFIIPYITGIHDVLYFEQFGEGHTAIITMASEELMGMVSFLDKFVLSSAYFFNIIGILFLLVIPSVVWYTLYRRRSFSLPNWVLGIFYASLPSFILVPAFKIADISSKNLMGVDILTQSVLSPDRYSLVDFFIRNLELELWMVIAVSLFTFFVVWLLSYKEKIKELFLIASVILGQLFFGVYIYYFFKNVAQYYMLSIEALMNHGQFFLMFFFVVFLILTVAFYVGGYFLFLWETWKG